MNWYKYLTQKLPEHGKGGPGLRGRLSGTLLAEKNNLWGVLKDLHQSQGFEQNRFHKEDLFTHLVDCYKLGLTYTQDPIFGLICLFHDIGKVRTRSLNIITGDWSFHKHEYVGSVIFSNFAEGLFPSHEGLRISAAIKH